MTDTPEKKVIDISGIEAALPHRYPFLLLDRVLDYEPDEWLVAIKNVTFNEPFFQGHFPGHPVMPGVLILEALAQASGMLAQLSYRDESEEPPLYYLVKIDNARFTRTVTPGDQLELHAKRKRILRGMGMYQCVAKVDGEVVASADIMSASKEREQ